MSEVKHETHNRGAVDCKLEIGLTDEELIEIFHAYPLGTHRYNPYVCWVTWRF
jgi:hypothetical protein